MLNYDKKERRNSPFIPVLNSDQEISSTFREGNTTAVTTYLDSSTHKAESKGREEEKGFLKKQRYFDLHLLLNKRRRRRRRECSNSEAGREGPRSALAKLKNPFSQFALSIVATRRLGRVLRNSLFIQSFMEPENFLP